MSTPSSAILACSAVFDVDLLLLALPEADSVDVGFVELLEGSAVGGCE